MNNKISVIVGDRGADLRTLRLLDQKSPVVSGLTTRSMASAVKVEVDKHLDKYPDIYDEFYRTSGISLFEREAKDLTNARILMATIGRLDLAEYDEPAYLMASIMQKMHHGEYNEISSEEVAKGFSVLYWVLKDNFAEFCNMMFMPLLRFKTESIFESFSLKVVGTYRDVDGEPQIELTEQLEVGDSNLILDETGGVILIGKK